MSQKRDPLKLMKFSVGDKWKKLAENCIKQMLKLNIVN